MRRLATVAVVFAIGLVAVGFAVAGLIPVWLTVATGAQEVPARTTNGSGLAIFNVSRDGSSISYQLTASNIDNVFMSHIHMAPPGVNGPIVVWLYPSTTPDVTAPLGSGRPPFFLARGTFTQADLVGPLRGRPLADLIDALDSGNAYVNYHTNDGVPPVNTGPGDFPGGEIRGNLRGIG